MNKIIVIMRSVICFICFFLLLIGCEKKDELPPKAKKITQKIIITKKEASKPEQPKVTETAKSGTIQEITEPMPKAAPDVSTEKVDITKEKRVASVTTPTEKINIPKPPEFYNPEGKLDPFEPLLKDESQNLSVKKKLSKKRRPLTPLEKVSLSQLKLAGIIIAPESGNRALIEEASGKGYIAKKGTYIGTNAGKIVNILKDRIIVQEEVEDIYGKIHVQEIEIKLSIPGEE